MNIASFKGFVGFLILINLYDSKIWRLSIKVGYEIYSMAFTYYILNFTLDYRVYKEISNKS